MASKRFSRIKKIFSGAMTNAEDEIFLLEGRFERFVHFWVLVIRQFIRHRCLVRASALSYSTLLALIPLLAVALSVTSSLLKSQDEAQFQMAVERFVSSLVPPATLGTNVVTVDTNFPAATNSIAVGTTNDSPVIAAQTNAVAGGAPEALVVPVTAQKEVARQIWSFVQNAQSGTLGAVGVVLLVLVAVSLLSRIEETFNEIWGVTRGRNWLHQMQLYSTTIILGPLLLIAALSLLGGAQFQYVKDYIAQTPFFGKLVFDLLPLVVLCFAFAFFYQLVPNAKVKFSAAIVGGAVAGTLWYLNNVFGFLYISRVVSNSKIYGSIGLVPVFMIGLYFSWVILLLGAQIAYAFQNRAAYLQDRLADNVNQRGREFVALRLMTRLGQRFHAGARPATVIQLSMELGIPSRLTQSILRVLAYNGLVTEVAGAEAAFIPARSLDTISAHDILFALRTGTGKGLPIEGAPELAEIYGEFAMIEQAERQAASSISLLALARRGTPVAALPESAIVSDGKEIVAAAAAIETVSEPEQVQPATTMEANPNPPPGATVATAAEAEIEVAVKTTPARDPAPHARREVAGPEENRDFPL